MKKMRTVLVVFGMSLTGCAPASPAPAPAPAPSTAPPRIVEVPPPPATTTTSKTPTVDPVSSMAVKAPVFSDDDCAADGDCRAQATCHPARCVAIANAGTMPAGTMCTMDCRGGTLDCGYNHCGCAKNAAGMKKCAVLPGGT